MGLPSSSAAAPDAWAIGVHTDYARLEPLWRALEEQGRCTVFQTYDWVSCWYETAKKAEGVRPLVVTVSDKSGGAAWLLPLCLHDKGGVRTITFADLHLSDYTAPVMGPNAPQDPATARALMNKVLKSLPPCDVVHFQKIIDKAGPAANPLAHLRGIRPFHVGRHGIRLSGPWPDMSLQTMTSRMRAMLRRRKRLLEEEQGEIAFTHHDRPETLAPALEKLMAMRNDRFEEINRANLPEPWLDFYRALISRERPGFGARIATMTVGGEEVASCFGILRGDALHILLPAFQMGKWAPYSPGLLLFDALLARFSTEMPGGYFDFTVGNESYKDRFGCDHHPLHEWMQPRSPKGLAVYCLWRAKEALRARPRLYERAKKISAFLRPKA